MSRIYPLKWAEESVIEIKGNDADFKTKVSKVPRGHKMSLPVLLNLTLTSQIREIFMDPQTRKQFAFRMTGKMCHSDLKVLIFSEIPCSSTSFITHSL